MGFVISSDVVCLKFISNTYLLYWKSSSGKTSTWLNGSICDPTLENENWVMVATTIVAQNFNLLLTQVPFFYVCPLLSYKGKHVEDITA